ncbi:hypothetical protein Z946_3509 [Sulfitobacter noctilucicola]|uniref:Type VI secretion system tube protein Hcp n=1 Tax=Sulfitobacter noctilucicola TaxID=1342301 RepID=A0A7W6Q5W9_9RHOB|nr:hypothetical protein [Sulfitobacter noctilucicola]KIN64617.1 hypothetical protein Z946_3509 [Sulfitobacter noctilucicola]MBB4174232.1 hypothetical protein [Sulfitobacter noctilucicola]
MKAVLHYVPKLAGALLCWSVIAGSVWAADISAFVGTYTGSAEIIGNDGSPAKRDMSVSIAEDDDGFVVQWSTATTGGDGDRKVKSYRIQFAPTERDEVFSARMQRNVFGKEVPLDPMKGEPYVWARILNDTLTVYSLFVTSEGGYEIQQFDRTLSEGGLELEYQAVSNGNIGRRVSTFLDAN